MSFNTKFLTRKTEENRRYVPKWYWTMHQPLFSVTCMNNKNPVYCPVIVIVKIGIVNRRIRQGYSFSDQSLRIYIASTGIIGPIIAMLWAAVNGPATVTAKLSWLYEFSL